MGKSRFKVQTFGSFKHALRFLEKLENGDFYKILDKYGKRGVDALIDYTPVNSGVTADSWFYEIEIKSDHASITWCNSNVHNGANVVLLLEYGHGTRFGGYVEGIDFVDPALQPIMDQIEKDIWREVQRSK